MSSKQSLVTTILKRKEGNGYQAIDDFRVNSRASRESHVVVREGWADFKRKGELQTKAEVGGADTKRLPFHEGK